MERLRGNHMSITLNAFRDYKYDEEKERLIYIGNEPIDLCASTWCNKIYPIMHKAEELLGGSFEINSYDSFNSADLVKARKLEVVEPGDMVIALETVRKYYLGLGDAESEDMVYFIDGVLLPRARKGLYFTGDCD